MKAVIFDMDGLMLDTERAMQTACLRAASEMGYSIEDTMYLQCVGRNGVATRQIFMDHYGAQFPFDDFRTRWHAVREDIFATEGIPIKPGLLELLADLDAHDIPIGVATSTSRPRAADLLTRTGLLSRFKTLTCGDEVVHGKPAPDIFLKSAQSLGVSPSVCTVLEDSEPGIVAAHAAGMRAICIPDIKPASPQVLTLAFAVYSSLHEAHAMLAGERQYPGT